MGSVPPGQGEFGSRGETSFPKGVSLLNTLAAKDLADAEAQRFQNALDRVLDRHPFKVHPFFCKWRQGTATISELETYGCYLMQQSREMPRAHAAVIANCPFPEARQLLATVMLEEEGLGFYARHYGFRVEGINTEPHWALALRLSEAVGMAPESWLERELTPAAQYSMANRLHFCQHGHWLEGLGFIYFGIKRAIRETYPRLVESLRTKYRFSKGIDFFTVHAECEAEHCRVGDELVQRYVRTGEDRDLVLRGAEAGMATTLHALRIMFPGGLM